MLERAGAGCCESVRQAGVAEGALGGAKAEVAGGVLERGS